MTTEFTISVAHNNARLAATLAFADAGPNPSRIEMFDAAANLLVTVILTKPCGVVSDGVLTLTQGSVGGDIILLDGAAATALWLSGTGVPVASGSVTDEAGDGPFIVEGADGTQLYAGGRAIIGATEIT